MVDDFKVAKVDVEFHKKVVEFRRKNNYPSTGYITRELARHWAKVEPLITLPNKRKKRGRHR